MGPKTLLPWLFLCIWPPLTAGLVRSFSPVVGILAMPEFKPQPGEAKRSYIAASYVKWLEAHGAHVVPLMYDASRKETEMLLTQLNGVVFPGGAFPMDAEYESFSRFVFSYVQNQKMPAWGECLGLLQFLLFTSDEASPGLVTSGWTATGPLLLPVNLTDTGRHWGPWAQMTAATRGELEHEAWAWHSHAWSIAESAFDASAKLKRVWKLLAVDQDRSGQSFVSAVAAKDFPITGLMFHPEKNSFEFLPERSGHQADVAEARSSRAIDAMGKLGHYFMDQCRGFRGVRFGHRQLMTWTIHNWSPKHTAPRDSVFEEMFFFPARNAVPQPSILGDGQPLRVWGLQ